MKGLLEQLHKYEEVPTTSLFYEDTKVKKIILEEIIKSSNNLDQWLIVDHKDSGRTHSIELYYIDDKEWQLEYGRKPKYRASEKDTYVLKVRREGKFIKEVSSEEPLSPSIFKPIITFIEL